VSLIIDISEIASFPRNFVRHTNNYTRQANEMLHSVRVITTRIEDFANASILSPERPPTFALNLR
jgi:hypothetical protein